MQRINGLKAGIEQRRVQRGVAGVADGEDAAEAAAAAEAEEVEAKRDMEAEKARYKASFERLRNLKKEIEHLQLLLEQSRQKLQGDFEKWYVVVGAGGARAEAALSTRRAADTMRDGKVEGQSAAGRRSDRHRAAGSGEGHAQVGDDAAST